MLLLEQCTSAASLAKSVMQREMCVTSYTASSLTLNSPELSVSAQLRNVKALESSRFRPRFSERLESR